MRSRLLVVVCVVLAAGIAVDSGAFSSVESDQGVTVETVGDESAFMALEYTETRATSGTAGQALTTTFVNVTNQFTESVDITVHYEVDDPDGTKVDSGVRTEDSLSVGEESSFDATFNCGQTGDYIVDFNVTADGESVFVETTQNRTVEYDDLTCDQSGTETSTGS